MTEPAEDLDALVRRVDPDRWLSSRFIADPVKRADVVTLYAYDYELAHALTAASNALAQEMRLVWWREALDEIFDDRRVRGHPTALALAEVVRRRDLPRAQLEEMIDGRYRLLDPAPLSESEVRAWSRATAGAAGWMAAAILSPLDPFGEHAAQCWNGLWAAARLPIDRVQDVDREEFVSEVRLDLGDARSMQRDYLPVAAFPAVAHVCLAEGYLNGRSFSDLGKRWRILGAVLTGRV